MTPTGEDPGALDAAAVDELRLLFSAPELARLLAAFLVELDTRPAMIAAMAGRGDYAGARREAHRFKGGALYFGRTPATVIAEAIETGDDAAIAPLARRLERSAGAMKAVVSATFA